MNFEDMLDDSLNLKIHIRIIQRNNKKSITIIENLEEIENIDLKKVNKCLKKILSCNGSIKTIENNKTLQFQGDHRQDIKTFLLETFSLNEYNIIIHG